MLHVDIVHLAFRVQMFASIFLFFFQIFHLKYVTGNLHPERVLSHIDPTQITRDPVQVSEKGFA